MSEFLSGSLWALVLTAGAYQLGLYLNKKTGSALLHPILVATAVIVPFLVLTGIGNETYQERMACTSWLLTPCTVCLGISLYNKLSRLRGHLSAVIIGVTAGTATSLLMIWGLSVLFGLDRSVMISLLPKSVTTAMAQPLSEGAGGMVALTTAAVIISGILGSVMGPALCKLFRLKDSLSIGTAYGTASHVVGTTRAAQRSEFCAAVSSLSLVVAGLETAVVFSFLG